MKPRTRLQIEVMDYHQQLYKRETELLPWARKECLDHIGFATKNRVACMDCGEKFPTLLVKRKRAVCPHCGSRLKIEQSRNTTYLQHVYFGVAELFRGYQVVRIFHLHAESKAGRDTYISCYEVVQHWYNKKEKYEIVALQRTQVSFNYVVDSWHGDFEIRKYRHSYGSYTNPDRYNPYPVKYHPSSEFRPEYKKIGIDHRLQELTFPEALKLIPYSSKLETLLKAGYYNLLSAPEVVINRFWPSFKICIRNKYKIQDASMYLDYLAFLNMQKKDLRNAHYVCPKNLKKAHDYYMKKRNRELELSRMKGRYIELSTRFGIIVEGTPVIYPKNLKRELDVLEARMSQEKIELEQKRLTKAEEKYRVFIQQFCDLVFKDKDLEIVPLKSLEEFKTEGDLLNHCVFTNAYYKRENCLILSARIGENRIETVEFDLEKLKVVQSRGKNNGNTEYHDRIIRVVNRNKKRIADRIRATNTAAS